MKGADGIADRDDLVAAAARQVDVLWIHEAAAATPWRQRPRVRRRQADNHLHARHAVARGKAIAASCSGVGGGGCGGIVAGKTFAGDTTAPGARCRCRAGAAGRDIEHFCSLSPYLRLP